MKKLFLLNLKVLGVFLGTAALIGFMNSLSLYFDTSWLFEFIDEKTSGTTEKAPWFLVGVFVLLPLVIAVAKKSRRDENRIVRWLRQISRWMATSSGFILSGMGGVLVGYGISTKFTENSFNINYITTGMFGLLMGIIVYSFAFKFAEDIRLHVANMSGKDKVLARLLAVIFSILLIVFILFDIYRKQIP